MFDNIPRQSPGDDHVPVSPIGGTGRGLASHGPEVVIECCCEGRDGVVRSGGKNGSCKRGMTICELVNGKGRVV